MTEYIADLTLAFRLSIFQGAILYSSSWKQELYKNVHIFLAGNFSKIYSDIPVCLSICSQRNGNEHIASPTPMPSARLTLWHAIRWAQSINSFKTKTKIASKPFRLTLLAKEPLVIFFFFFLRQVFTTFWFYWVSEERLSFPPWKPSHFTAGLLGFPWEKSMSSFCFSTLLPLWAFHNCHGLPEISCFYN